MSTEQPNARDDHDASKLRFGRIGGGKLTDGRGAAISACRKCHWAFRQGQAATLRVSQKGSLQMRHDARPRSRQPEQRCGTRDTATAQFVRVPYVATERRQLNVRCAPRALRRRASRRRRRPARRAPRRRRRARSRRGRSRRAAGGRRGPAGRLRPAGAGSPGVPRCCAIERSPLWPASPPPSRACSRPGSRSLSSWTTRIASGSSLKNAAAALTERPDSFMYVSGCKQRDAMPVDPHLGELARRTFRARSRRAGARAHRRPSSRRCGGSARTRDPGCRDRRRAGRATRRVRPVSRAGASGLTPRSRSRRRRLVGGLAVGRLGAGSASSAPSPPSAPSAASSRAPPRASELDARDHGLVGIVEQRDAVRHFSSESRSVSPISSSETSSLEMLRNLERQRLDVTSFVTWLRTPPSLHADRLADERDGDSRLDRLVEPDFLQVDVRDRPANLVALEVLEDRRMLASRRRSRRRARRATRRRRSAQREGRARRPRSRPASSARRGRPGSGPACAGAETRPSRAWSARKRRA